MPPERPRPSTDRSRRRFIAGSGAALATSLSALTAGCLSALPPLGDEQRYGRLDVPDAGDPTYRDWLPAPSSVDRSVEQFHAAIVHPKPPRFDAPELYVARRAHCKADLDYFGIGFGNYERVVDSSFGTVVTASFERPSVLQTVTDSGYERTGEYDGYAVFARSDVPRRVAVGDGVVVWTSAYHHDAPHLEALIDARNGDRERFHQANSAFERLTTAAGDNPSLGITTDVHDPTGRPVLLADAFRFDDDAAYQVVHYHYEPDRTPTTDALEAALQNHTYRFADEAQAFDVGIDGQIGTVESRVPRRSERDLPPKYDLPQVTWGLTHDADTETVTFRHEAGDDVPANRLFSDVDRPSAPGKVTKRPLWTDRNTVSEGATASVDLDNHPEATSVNLVYATDDLRYTVLFGRSRREDSDA